jgi:IS605 OrfB family transposase
VLHLRVKDKHAEWLSSSHRWRLGAFTVTWNLRSPVPSAPGIDSEPARFTKIANRRKDFLHKLSTELTRAKGAIFVGNVNASGLAKTRMAKSVLDAGWSAFRTMLQYKCDDAGVWFAEVDEAFSTQTCSVFRQTKVWSCRSISKPG